MDSTAVFEEHRELLFGVAYEMLGRVVDAEDVVQETWVRWSADDRSEVRDPRAYLVRIASRLALNRLRTLKTRRESYVGPWLPEPLVTSAGTAADGALTAESVSMAMLVVLETLSPLERAVFVLREVFGFPHRQVGRMLDRSEPAVRQTAHRAREHVRARRPRYDADPATRREVVDRFLQAAVSGQVDELMEVLAPDVALWSDGGGRVRAARRPIRGADDVARFLAGISGEGESLTIRPTEVNGRAGGIVTSGRQIIAAVSVETAGGRVAAIRAVLNPDKLQGLPPAADTIETDGRRP